MLLIIVFSLNTIVSFACSLGGGFHSFHHQRTGADKASQHNHHQGRQHDHDDAKNQHPVSSEKSGGDCCSKDVLEIEKKDKSVARSIAVPNFSFLTSLIISSVPLFLSVPADDRTRYSFSNIRWRVPATIQDLRIVIQSFQI